MMKGISPAFGLRPFSQLLGQATVECFFSFPPGKAQIFRHAPLTFLLFPEIGRIAAKKVLQAQSLFRRFGMQGKGPPLNLDPILVVQLFNTPGTEVAPGSNIIGKNFERDFHLPPP